MAGQQDRGGRREGSNARQQRGAFRQKGNRAKGQQGSGAVMQLGGIAKERQGNRASRQLGSYAVGQHCKGEARQ
jgi:hypothetical protein